MNRAILQFQINLNSAKHLGVIHQAFEKKLTGALPLDELLRAEIVLAVSALDCYVHDIVRIRMTDTLAATHGESDAYLNFGVSLKFVKCVLGGVSAADQAVLFEQEIRRHLSFKTFQKADAISEALSLIGVQSLWKKVSSSRGIPAGDIKTELNLIVDRRNRIAHEGDIDPSAGFALKFPIDFITVQAAVRFIEKITTEIHTIIVREAAS